MCGIVSIIYEKENKKMGIEACNLLKKLEYRGYDSTGAAFIDDKGNIILKKKVGAPSKVVHDLNIDKFAGKTFIGQVRWATFGSVTDKNSQPHEVNCFINLIGAHNGNISNCDTLKEFLAESGHKIISDNDGEIIVHLVEHFYNINLKNFDKENIYESNDFDNFNKIFTNIFKFDNFNNGKNKNNFNNIHKKLFCFIDAIRKADEKANGSYAAAIIDPEIDGIFAIKSGSSLYAGIGEDENGKFILVSSDLTSVLSKTRFLIPIKEGEGIFFNYNNYFIFNLSGRLNIIKPEAKRSKLNLKDTTLSPRYHFYMEQEIFSSSSNIDEILLYYFYDTKEEKLFDFFEQNKEDFYKLFSDFTGLSLKKNEDELKKEFNDFINSNLFNELWIKYKNIAIISLIYSRKEFISSEKQFLSELIKFADIEDKLFLIDNMILWKKKRKIIHFFNFLIYLIIISYLKGGRIFTIASGTSYHACLTGSYFFNNLTKISLIATNPGGFRSVYLNGVKKDDIIIVVTQSGETKDLVDIIQDIKKLCNDVHIVSLVNNENSRIPQELSDFYLPILCGPEIAVAATKSFISQILLFYMIAFRISKIFEDSNLDSERNFDSIYPLLKRTSLKFNDELKTKIYKIKELIDDSLKKTDKDLTEVALKLYLKPSIHILGTSLIGIAKEGALKIREVVLNHTEGYDSAEFKHGPNTILGKNTIFSIEEVTKLFSDFVNFLKIKMDKNKIDLTSEIVNDFFKALLSCGLDNDKNFFENFNENNASNIERLIFDFKKSINIENYFSNYPLIFICNSDDRDKRITISQIHTHKIRGADIILIAENDDELYKAISNSPADSKNYYYKFIEVKETDDKNLFVFPVTVILQNLAFKMSVMKMKYLNSLHIENHGVHPDAPKNVSKSITVD
ncbi:MAG: SIS domain-containing protein [Spirochaetes bacterium]|nr:SIS domain-containing protein [Spirochaetota bacterium]